MSPHISVVLTAGCATFDPPATPCNDLTAEMYAIAGGCDAPGWQCSDNLYIAPYGNATLGVATVATNDVNDAWTAWLNLPAVWTAIHAKAPRMPWDGCGGVNYNVTWPSSLPDYEAGEEPSGLVV